MASTPRSHKPRKQRKGDFEPIAVSAPSSSGSVVTDPETKQPVPTFPLGGFLWPIRGGTSQWVTLPCILMVAGLFRWALSLWNYSGFQAPPMHGDFEAQRHWMELTIHLPVSKWYFYDLEWWGLDYPPLTAYHSWILGKIGSMINPKWFELDASRGLDDPSLKLFMRASVLVSEYLIYVPAVVIFLRRYRRLQQVNSWDSSIALAAILLQPGTLLIDHAHFQYNTVMLGFVVASISSVMVEHFLWSAAFFVAALGFKQMALYYAPVVFVYLLGSCLFPRIRLVRLTGIAVSTILSFGLVFSPLLAGALNDAYRRNAFTNLSWPTNIPLPPGLTTKPWFYPALLQLAQSIHRIFPFARGLFEDKVANFWCALHTFHKLHRYPVALLQRISLGATLLSIAPPCLLAWRWPSKSVLLYAMSACAWGFFLFSFQVHEKSVLLPLLPMTLLLGGNKGLQESTRSWIAFANILGTWTMFPLLKRDELRVPYFVLTLLWAWLMGVPSLFTKSSLKTASSAQLLEKLLHGVWYVSMIAWHVGEAFVVPPSNKPDLWVVVNVLIGAPGFGLCYLWCIWSLWDRLPRSKATRTADANSVHTKKML